MSDDLVKKLRDPALGFPDCFHQAAADLIESQAAEITRLRAACDAYFKTISLSQIRHGRILVGLERRNARQRRVLAKLYQRRHDKNVALATARLEGIGEAVSQARARADFWASGDNKEAKIRHDEARKIAAAISAAAKEDRLSEEIIREDRDAWPDRQANDPIRAAAKEGKP